MAFLRTQTEAALAQQNTQMTPDQLEATLKMGSVFGLAFTPITSIAMWLILSAVLFLGTKILKGEGSFKQFMSITGYSYVIMLLYYILSAAVSLFSGELMLNTSIGILASGLKGSYIYGVLRNIDLFGIWYYSVMAIGITTLTKLSKTRSYAMMSIVYLASILIGAFNSKTL
jgi:hypothetical protein